MRHPQTSGIMQRFNRCISEVLASHRFDSREALEATLKRYCHLYSQHIPQIMLNQRTPIQAKKDWQPTHPELFIRHVRNHAGPNRQAGVICMPTFYNDESLSSPVFPGSHVVSDDHYIFVSGLTVVDIPAGAKSLGDVAAETRCVLEHLQRILSNVGSGLDAVVRVDVHLTDIEQIEVMDSVYAEFFDGQRYPARTCTESSRLYGNAQVEITVMAQRSGGTKST